MAKNNQNNVVFDEGYKEYTINGDENRVIRVNPTDYDIVTRADEATKRVAKHMEKYDDIQINADGTADASEERAVEALRDITQFMREQINYIFNADVADIAFNGQSPVSTKNGVTLFERFVTAMLSVIGNDIEKENKKAKELEKEYMKQAQRFKNKL